MLVLYYLFIITIGLQLGNNAASAQTYKPNEIHKQMNKDDLRRVFQVESHDLVPEYHVVLPKLLNSNRKKRSTDGEADKQIKPSKWSPKAKEKIVHLKVFGKAMQLNLKPNENFNEKLNQMKVLLAESGKNGKLKYVEDKLSKNEDLGHTYHDDSNLAAVLVSHNRQGNIQMDGTIGSDFVIKPVPSNVELSSVHLDELSGRDDDEMFLDEDELGSMGELSSNSKQTKSSSTNSTAITKTIVNQKESNKDLVDGSRQPYSSSTVPKLHKLNVDSDDEQLKRKKMERRKQLERSAHIVYKKGKAPKESHSDFVELEPGSHGYHGHFVPNSNWTLLHQFPRAVTLNNDKSGNRDQIKYQNNSNQGVQFDENLYDELDLAHSFESVRYANTPHRRSKRQAPDTVWPEVLLVVDYDSYLLHGANSRDVKRYFISFWNGVDLRYKLLSHPTIRISLAGMIVAKDRDATPYLERNRLRAPNSDAVDAAGALTDMGKYLYREDRLPTYDLAVVITKLDMCRRRYEGGRCNRGTAGFAYVGGACVVNKRLEKVNSVAIIEDSGGFSGIIVAAHEVGHLLGCVHDGSPPPSYLGGPGASNCAWEDGFIMSDLRHTERGFRWSSCSTEQFKHFLNGETSTCLYNYPHENQLLPRVLPGTMLTLDEQCKRDRGTNACFKDARVCAQLFCFDSASGYCVSYRPAAEGSPCGDGQVCRNGKCVAELENIIPDYTHVTQTISRSPISRSDTSNAIVYNNVPVNSGRRNKNRSTRSRSRRISSTSSTTPSTNKGAHYDTKSDDYSCVDQVEKMAGSLSCMQFLNKFSHRYCNHDYIKRNCCASHAIVCGGNEE